MNNDKLSSDEVPQKFVEWLLALGCPAEKIPSIEKIEGMCKAVYNMAWRSLMEHVQAKDVIGHKRLTVFYDDVKLCQEKKLLNERGSNALLPEQLSLWKECTELKAMVSEAEANVGQARINLNELLDKISSKLVLCNSARKGVEDLQRRSWLLSQVSCELTTKIGKLEETRVIAKSLSNAEREQHDDIERKVDKCIALLQRKNSSTTVPLPSPVASSSIVSNPENDNTHNEKDDYVLSIVKCRGEVLWPHLCEKLVSLNSKLSQAYAKHVDVENNRSYTRTILAYTAGLHSALALEATKNTVHIKRVHQELAVSIQDLNSYVSEDAFELLLVKFKRAYCEARVNSLKALFEELTSRSGIFDCGGNYTSSNVDARATLGKIASIDKCIVNSRYKLERLMSSLASTERKMYDIRECLLTVFSALHNNISVGENERFRGVQLDFPKESIGLLRQFYTKRCERNEDIENLSLKLDVSDNSFINMSENPKFVDELRIYLRKFNLEKNRKLVLDSGEKAWIFETLQPLSSRLHSQWMKSDVTPLLCPSVRPSCALRRLYETRTKKDALTSIAEAMNGKYIHNIDIDITAFRNHEADMVDKMKKRIAENLKLLQKIHKNVKVSQENLKFWSKQQLKEYISPERTVDGKTYRDYERYYLEELMWNL